MSNDAFGKDGWVREGLSEGMNGVWHVVSRVLLVIGIIAIVWFALQWAYDQWYITTHCTTVLGTRVCQ